MSEPAPVMPALDHPGSALGDALAALGQWLDRRGSTAAAARLQDLTERLGRRAFNLVVLGEFKRGKTTLINALLGDDLLPTAVVPLTSVVTILRYGPVERVEVRFTDGGTKTVPRTALDTYITEPGNPHNGKGVQVVWVEVPADLLRGGLHLVDTPGVGSVYEHNTEAARAFLPQVDGALLLLASDPPVSSTECQFLREMQSHAVRLFVVQNKVDQLRPADLADALQFTKTVLREAVGDDALTVYPLSARQALEAKLAGDQEGLAGSGLLSLEAELQRFAATEQEGALSESVGRKAWGIAEQERLALDLERQALRMSVEEIEARYAEFRRRRDQTLTQREDDSVLIRAAARQVIQGALQRDYTEECRVRPPVLRRAAADWGALQGDVSAGELLERGNAFIKTTLFEAIGAWRRMEEQRLESELGATLGRFTERTNEALLAIHTAARDVFELPPISMQSTTYLSAPSEFLWRDWRWEPQPGLGASFLLRVLPGARARALGLITAKLVEEHRMACGRLRHDFGQRAQVAFDGYAAVVSRSLSEGIAALERAITRALEERRSVSTHTAEAEARLGERAQELEAIIAALHPTAPRGASDAL